jgi:nicotinamidase-related amidase
MTATPPRPRLPLTSEQLELLLAFEAAPSLAALAQLVAKDPSVVSRGLQRLADAAPVIAKVSGRWQLTPLGKTVNARTAGFIQGLAHDLGSRPALGTDDALRAALEGSALVVVNAQRGLLGGAEKATGAHEAVHRAVQLLASLVQGFRAAKRPVAHVHHASPTKGSAFFHGSPGAEPLQMLAPSPDEAVVQKEKASAFAGTSLQAELEARGVQTVVVAGFTANECLDATARQAVELGFGAVVVGDASASLDVRGPDGTLYPAERIHRLTLANLHSFVAQVVDTRQVLAALPSR